MDDERLHQLLRKMDAPAEPDAGFADELFVRMRTEAARAPAGRPRMLPLLAALLLLVVALATGLAVGAGVLRLPWLVADGSPAPSASPVAEESASPTAPVAATATAQPSASPGPEVAGITPGDLVETTVEGLIVRADPGTDAERLGTLAFGSISYVVGGPDEVGSYPWYLVSGMGLPPATGCGVEPGLSSDPEPFTCPYWFGWVAGADEADSPWLAEHAAECPEPPGELVDLTLARAPLELLHCYEGDDLVFRAWWPAERHAAGDCDAPPEIVWLRCPQVVLGWDPGYYEAVYVAVDPDSGTNLQQSILPDAPAPEPGTEAPAGRWIEVTAHLGDPEAGNCANAAAATDEDLQVILGCRTIFVVTGAEATSAP